MDEELYQRFLMNDNVNYQNDIKALSKVIGEIAYKELFKPFRALRYTLKKFDDTNHLKILAGVLTSLILTEFNTIDEALNFLNDVIYNIKEI